MRSKPAANQQPARHTYYNMSSSEDPSQGLNDLNRLRNFQASDKDVSIGGVKDYNHTEQQGIAS